jgi:hypothetical protein
MVIIFINKKAFIFEIFAFNLSKYWTLLFFAIFIYKMLFFKKKNFKVKKIKLIFFTFPIHKLKVTIKFWFALNGLKLFKLKNG